MTTTPIRIVPEIPVVHMAFDFKKYEDMGTELLTEARKLGKELGLKVHDYQQQIATLAGQAASGKISTDTAMAAIKLYNRSMRMALATARQKIEWDLVDKYREASSELIQWLLLLPLQLISKL